MSAARHPTDHIQAAPMDPILGTKILYKQDKDPRKVNLGIGAFRTNEGKPYVLNAVRKADERVAADRTLNKEYLPQSGYAPYCAAVQRLLFGADSDAVASGRIATVQSLSGTGGLRLAAEYIKKFFDGAKVFYPNPTWGNHKGIMTATGLQHGSYRYWNAETRGLDLQGMLEDIRAAPSGSFILLHACAHNPTGVDPTQAQWREIMATVRDCGHTAFIDSAYQGFATGSLDRDAFAIRLFAENNVPFVLCTSFAKNMGLYNERVGTFNVSTPSAEKAKAIVSQLNKIVRTMYSNPPSHGAFVVQAILEDAQLRREWEEELTMMSKRISDMRQLLRGELEKLGTPGDWSHITSQIGMFSFTGLSPRQCEQMIQKHHVYMLKNGRISMCGVSTHNAAYIAAAIDDVVRNVRSQL